MNTGSVFKGAVVGGTNAAQNNISTGVGALNLGSNGNYNGGNTSNVSNSASVNNSGSSGSVVVDPKIVSELYSCVQLLPVADQKALALAKLYTISKNSPECTSILTSVLWHSFGTIAILLQEIVSVYPYLSSITPANQEAVVPLIARATHAISLLAYVANSNETKHSFLSAYILVYLYPFIGANERIFEGLCLSSLLVVGSLVKVDRQPTPEQPEMIKYLLETDFFSRCLDVIKNKADESLRSKVYATYILDKILADNMGYNYICDNQSVFYIVTSALASIILKLVDISNLPNTANFAETGARILTHIVRCYLRLSESRTNRDQLRVILPDALKTPILARRFHSGEDITTMIAQINQNLASTAGPIAAANYSLGAQPASSSGHSIALGQSNYANFLSENSAQSAGASNHTNTSSNNGTNAPGNSYPASKGGSKWLS